jgi:hypothetical protein
MYCFGKKRRLNTIKNIRNITDEKGISIEKTAFTLSG